MFGLKHFCLFPRQLSEEVDLVLRRRSPIVVGLECGLQMGLHINIEYLRLHVISNVGRVIDPRNSLGGNKVMDITGHLSEFETSYVFSMFLFLNFLVSPVVTSFTKSVLVSFHYLGQILLSCEEIMSVLPGVIASVIFLNSSGHCIEEFQLHPLFLMLLGF